MSATTGTRVRDFVFVRHGETDWNREHRVQGSRGASLNPAGHEQSKALARLLWEVPLQAVYSSTLPRAVETASYVAGPHGVSVVTDPRLNEIHHGDWEGLAEADLPDPELYRRWREDPSSCTLPGAEPLSAVRDRAVEVMREIAARHPADAGLVGVVSHQIVLALLKCYILDRPLSQVRALALSVASYEVVSAGEGFAPRP
ncbi:MAG TPA: histidine phosphatase family protein [Candidatus Eisenbacteria bacterium]